MSFFPFNREEVLAGALANQERERIVAQKISLDQWWGDAASASKPQDAYRRLIDAVRIAVEQAYTIDRDVIGLYAEAAGSSDGAAYDYFSRFVLATQGEGFMPPWWTFRHWKELRTLALSPTGEYFLGHAREISDVRREWGYESSKVLRSLSFRVHKAMWDENGRYRYGKVHEDRGDDEMPACRAFLKDHCKWGSFCRYRHVNKDDMPVCTFFLKGMCKHGDSCSFRHSQLDDDIPACTFFLEGRCRNSSESCTFRHVEDTEDVHSQESFGEEESHEGTPDMASTMAGAPAVSSNATSINEDRDSNTDVTGDGFSMVPLVDHLVEIAGGIVELKELLRLYLSALGAAVDEDCDVTLASFDSGMGPAKRKAQKLLKARSDAGDPTAQYLWGKLLECQQVIVLDKTGSQSNAALKVWMMSAQSGHAMAMARLGLMHRNEGEQSTANHWWEKAICVAEMPEASYNLGVSFGLGQNGNPINYSTAAMYYAHTADINLDSYRSKGFTKVVDLKGLQKGCYCVQVLP
jgi:hypothetical protein